MSLAIFANATRSDRARPHRLPAGWNALVGLLLPTFRRSQAQERIRRQMQRDQFLP